MQFQLVPGFFIFLGSYLPLAIILTVQDIPFAWWRRPICAPDAIWSGLCDLMPFTHPVHSLTFLAVSAAAVLLARLSLATLAFPFRIEVKTARAAPNDVINYTFPYVVSFMGIAYDQPEKLLGFAVFLLWMFAITYKSGQILMNPLLLILGWRHYNATIVINNVEKEVHVLSRRALASGAATAQTIQDFYVVGHSANAEDV